MAVRSEFHEQQLATSRENTMDTMDTMEMMKSMSMGDMPMDMGAMQECMEAMKHMMEACMAMGKACSAACMEHADMHETCRYCAKACDEMVAKCEAMMASMAS